MKIALFVLSCLIAVSRQQNALWSMPQYHQKVPFQYRYPVSHNLRQWGNIFSGSYPYYSSQYSFTQPQYVKYFPSQNPGVVLFKSFQQPVSSLLKFLVAKLILKIYVLGKRRGS